MIIQQEQVRLIPGMQGWFNMGIHQHNSQYKQTQKNNQNDHIIRCWESIWQYSILIHGKSPETQGPYPNIVKAIYSKWLANNKLNGEKIEVTSLNSGPKQGCPISPYLFNIVLEFLARAIRQPK